MHKETHSQTRLKIIQLECPEFTNSDFRLLEKEKISSKLHQNRDYSHIPEIGRRAFQRIYDFTPHQAYYHYLFKLAERDGTMSVVI